jgi:uncharacterized protein
MHPPAAIAHQPAARGDSVKFTERGDPILQWPRIRRPGGWGRIALSGHLLEAQNFGEAEGKRRMALELRPNCEYCDKDLPANATDARICSYECTFCAVCVETVLRNVCPNCGGGFTARPIRPAREWRPGLSLAKRPASTKRAGLSFSREAIAGFVREVAPIAPDKR